MKKGKEYYISLILIMFSVLFWGYSFISTKVVLTELPPVSIAFFRQIIASIALFCWLLSTRSLSPLSIRHLWLVAVSGLFGIVLYFVFENTGLQYTTASNASMIVAAVPVFTLISEVLFFKLKANAKMLVCILLSIAGVYMVITVDGRLDLSSSTFMGNLLVIGAMIAWVIYTIFNKKLNNKYSSLVITFYQSVTSIFLFIPFVAPEVGKWKAITLIPLLNLIYLGIFCSALAYFFYIYASKRLGATISSASLNLIPVVSVVFGYFLLGEKLSLLQIAGMALIMLSLYKLSKNASSNEITENELIKNEIPKNEISRNLNNTVETIK